MQQLQSFTIKPQSGIACKVSAGEFIRIIDIEGKQSGDFFAVAQSDHSEFFSSGVTLDCNRNFYLKESDYLYSNKYNALLQITEDTVKSHDLIHPTCSQRMYEVQYDVKEEHPSCHKNIQRTLKEFGVEYPVLLTVFNFFMNTQIGSDGSITVKPPVSKPGDYIILKACMDLIISVTACSVTQSSCNDFSARPLRVEILL
jgi:uncharacterized protein YcgI (DUF1989 family)